MTVNDKTRDRIAKLLRLAQDGSNVNESANAFAQAQRLATRAGLDLDSIDTSTDWQAPNVEEIDSRVIERGKRIAYWRKTLACAVAVANGCKVFMRPSEGLMVYGQPRDMDACAYFYRLACVEVDRLASANAGRGRSWLHSFRSGAAHEIGNAIRTSAREAISASPVPESDPVVSSTALARRDALATYHRDVASALDRWGANAGLSSARSTPRVNPTAYARGRVAGSTVRVSGHRAIGSGSG